MVKSTYIANEDALVNRGNPLPVNIASFTSSIPVDVNISTSEADTITEYNITCTLADTEYSQALPANTLAFEFRNRNSHDTRWSFVTGKVAVPTAPYNTLSGGQVYYKEGIDLVTKTLYFASSTAGDVIELVVYT